MSCRNRVGVSVGLGRVDDELFQALDAEEANEPI
jgi:hypothetical protein